MTKFRAGNVKGPRCPTERDIPALNRLFSDAFTDRYRRDGLAGVKVPQLNSKIWTYAIRDSGDGAMIWEDDRDNLVAFNIAHHSGVEGWMGPLAVRSDRQSSGIGRTIVSSAVEWLRGVGARIIGLETMPRTVDNIGFYGKLGFVPRHLTVTMTAETVRRDLAGGARCLGSMSGLDYDDTIEQCRLRLDKSLPGYDFTRELELTLELEIGDVVVIEQRGELKGFALWHSAPLTGDDSSDELRVLKVFADSENTFERLVLACEQCAVDLGIQRVAVRCQTAYEAAFRGLVKLGYLVRWTDLRMTLHDCPEALPPAGEVLFSNWEI